MRLNKKRWFNTQVLEFEIMFYGYPIYPDNYTIMSYIAGQAFAKAPCLTTYADTRYKPTDVKEIIDYFKPMSITDAFFEARRIARKHRKEKKKCYIDVSYKTVKQRDKNLKELL